MLCHIRRNIFRNRVETKAKTKMESENILATKLVICEESDVEEKLAGEKGQVGHNEKDLAYALLLKENQELKLTISQQKEELKEIKDLLKKLVEGQNETAKFDHVEMSTPVAKKVGLDNLVQTLRSIKLGQQIKESIPMRSFSEIVSGQASQVNKESISVEKSNEIDVNIQNSKSKVKMQKVKKESQKTRKERLEKLASTLIQPKKAPMEVSKMHIKLSDVRVLKKAASPSEARKIIWALINAQGIRDHVLEISLIGLSIVELYINAERKIEIEQVLTKKEIEILVDYNPLMVPTYAREENIEPRIVKRISWMYGRARTQRLKACMLEGLPENVCQEIIAESINIQKVIKEKNEAVASAIAKSQ